MTPDEAEEYTQSLGQIVGGTWRQVAWAERQGIPAALGLSLREWVSDRLGGYVRLEVPERREAVAELADEGMSQREIGDVLGVDHKTVGRDLGASAPTELDVPEEPQVTEPGDTKPGADAPPDEPEGDAALEDAILSSPDLQRGRWQTAFMGAIAKSFGALSPFDVRDVAQNADEDLLEELDRLAKDITNYAQRVRKLRPATELRSISGGRQ
jgi:hypothetical protein